MTRYYKISPNGLSPVIDKLETIPDYIRDSEPGDLWTIEVIEMTKEEYEKLPEHGGF